MAQNAVVALGLIGAGTNHARLAGLLRNLASYYYKEPNLLFLVRVAQGLVHMGKGLVGVSPYHTEKQLLSGERAATSLCLSGLFDPVCTEMYWRSLQTCGMRQQQEGGLG